MKKRGVGGVESPKINRRGESLWSNLSRYDRTLGDFCSFYLKKKKKTQTTADSRCSGCLFSNHGTRSATAHASRCCRRSHKAVFLSRLYFLETETLPLVATSDLTLTARERMTVNTGTSVVSPVEATGSEKLAPGRQAAE